MSGVASSLFGTPFFASANAIEIKDNSGASVCIGSGRDSVSVTELNISIVASRVVVMLEMRLYSLAADMVRRMFEMVLFKSHQK